MKILFYSYAYPNPAHPGLGTFNRTMIAGLATDHEVRVVSPVPFTESWRAWAAGRLPRGLNDSSFQAVPNVPAEYRTWYYTPKLFRNLYGRFMRQSVRSSLDRAMRDFQPDIVLSYWAHPDGEVAVKTAHQFGVRAVTMVGGSDVLLLGRQGSRRQAILDVLRAADGVVTVSADIQRVLVADGIPVDKIFVARRGVDRRVFHGGDRTTSRSDLGLPDDLPILISVGRLVDVKGHTHLIDACDLLTRRGVKFRCYLLGDGPLRAKLKGQIERLRLQDAVQLRGSQTPAQLADWYRAANVSVLPSLSEGVPNVLLESLASGTPFVASNVGGISEIADPVLDKLVPVASPLELADAIAESLSTTAAQTTHSRRAEPLTIGESARKLSRILQSIYSGGSIELAVPPQMHETAKDSDLSGVDRVARYSAPSLTKGFALVSAMNPAGVPDDDLCARTGENFFLRQP
jgi:teichuronic acid biosynthesis glycosyltransferase TuaC